MADKVKDKARARLKERKKATAPIVEQKEEKTKSALARGVQRQKNEQIARKKAAPAPQPASLQSEKKEKRGFAAYIAGVRTETKKVVWPTRKEMLHYTVIVLATCTFFGLFLWGVDTGFLAIIREVFGIG